MTVQRKLPEASLVKKKPVMNHSRVVNNAAASVMFRHAGQQEACERLHLMEWPLLALEEEFLILKELKSPHNGPEDLVAAAPCLAAVSPELFQMPHLGA